MTQKYAYNFWYRLLSIALEGSHGETLPNPALEFRKRAKSGEFDSLTDEHYNEFKNDVEEESALFGYARKANPDNVLLNAFECLDLRHEELAHVCRLLALAAERTDFRTAMEHLDHSDQTPPDTCRLQRGTLTPQLVYDYLNETIYGQDAAKRQAATIVYNHSRGIRSNSIFAGPTGCGKSEIWRALAREYPYIFMFDASTISANGWKGGLHVSTIFRSIPAETLREGVILVLDEIDKLFEPAYGNGVDYSQLVQANLLKLFDGDTLYFEGDNNLPPLTVNASTVSCVCLGAFERLLNHVTKAQKNRVGFGGTIAERTDADYTNTHISMEDMIKHGNVRREIAGRIGSITLLSPMTADDFLALLNSSASPVNVLSNTYEIPISVSDALKRQLADQAAESRLGVRYIRSELTQRVDSILFKDPETDSISLTVTDPAAAPEMSP